MTKYTNKKLHQELTAWNRGDLTKTAPSALNDPNGLLFEAKNFENGYYECSDEEQQERSQAAIDAYCKTTEAAEY